MVAISDHALVRYIERVLKVPLDHIRNDMIAKVSSAAKAGAVGVTVDGFTYKLGHESGPCIVTVLPVAPEGKKQHPPASKQRSHTDRRNNAWRRRKNK